MKLKWGSETLTIEIQAAQQLAELPLMTTPWFPISLSESLAQPTEFPTLEKCATPDDRVVVAIDPSALANGFSLPCILDRIAAAGIAESQVTFILPRNATNSALNVLKVMAGDCLVERHDPKEQSFKVLLGGTNDGQLIYLNKKIVEADLLVIVSGTQRSNSQESPASLIFPGMACDPTSRINATEVFRLIGSPYLVVNVEGPAGNSPKWFAGSLEAYRRAKAFRKQYWELELREPVDMLVIDWPNKTRDEGFRDWARAVFRCLCCLENGGRVVVVSSKTMDDSSLSELIYSIQTFHDDYTEINQIGDQNKKALKQWFKALEKCTIFILNSISAEICENHLQANKISGLASIQKLASASERILLIHDPDRCSLIPVWKNQ